METGVPSAPRTADPIPQMKRLHFKPIRIGWWLLVIAFLLGAGFRLIIHSTGGTSNGNTPNPATSTEQTSSGPATQPAAEPAGQPVRIEVELDSTKGVLRISSPDHKAIEFVGTDKPAWNERKGEYKFKDFAKSRKMLDSGEARLDVIGPGSASLVSDSKGRWHADIDAPGSYDVIWSAKNDTLGSFIVKRLGSGAHDE